MSDIEGVLYLERMPKLKQNIDTGGRQGELRGGTRAVVEAIDGDVITVFDEWGETRRLRVIELTETQRAFVELVRNAMITGFMDLVNRQDEVMRASVVSKPGESAHDVLSRVLNNAPAAFIACRPFEVTEILEKLATLPSDS